MPSTFTVFFEDPFWVGVLEVAAPDGVRAARHVFGSEPTGPELLAFALRRSDELIARALAAPAVEAAAVGRPYRANPKRAARAAEAEHRGSLARAKAKARHRGR
ncbi:DUF2992 family protein [Streptomyces sp. NPDC017056]|uniref:DUF2992 family protein n=1 Tax=Streptomyces sp. NPDC017056 TaxID=3364973 RepID=UPI00378B0B4B